MKKKAKKNRMSEEFLASTVMTHHSKAVCFISLSSRVGVGGGVVWGDLFFISALTISLIKSVEPLSPPSILLPSKALYTKHTCWQRVKQFVEACVYVYVCV